MKKTIIVSNRLPVKISLQNEQYQLTPSAGGLATGLGSIYKTGNNIWIGWPGTEINQPDEVQVQAKLLKQRLVPVYLKEAEIAQFYEGYSNSTLWPVFHYMPMYARYSNETWDCYKSVNEKFRDVVLQHAADGDTIWVHDYQLLLLPDLLRTALPNSTIGFFLHIPFPSFEIFRLLPNRAELLQGMLGADLVGFHTYDDATHFDNAVSRLLAYHSSAKVVTVQSRQVMIDSFPMGISFEYYDQLAKGENVAKKIQNLKKNLGKKRIILSIDRLDYSKGILQRLEAFDTFLKQNPAYHGQVSLYMVVVPSRDTVPQYKALKDEIDKYAGDINARNRTNQWTPVFYFYRSFSAEAITALYSTADVCLVTPMRDGMNLVAKEYVACRTENDGVLILSEMAGASRELVDAIQVNPNNVQQLVDAMLEALNMPLADQQKRMLQMRQLIERYNINHWVNVYMKRLRDIKQMQQTMEARRAASGVQKQIIRNYSQAQKRILFLDYDGTLVDFNGNPDLSSPDADLYRLFKQLTADEFNKVVIISGRKYETLEKWFSGLKIDLIAEHGVWFKEDGEWKHADGIKDEWKQDVLNIMNTYTDRTPGSFIETKSYSLVWHYRKADSGLGELRANELINNLRVFAQDRLLQVLNGNKVVEIKSAEINKGKAAIQWMKNENFDFIMGIGDDHTDEDLFRALPDHAYTIKVGSNHSFAKYFLENSTEVRKLLLALTSPRYNPAESFG